MNWDTYQEVTQSVSLQPHPKRRSPSIICSTTLELSSDTMRTMQSLPAPEWWVLKSFLFPSRSVSELLFMKSCFLFCFGFLSLQHEYEESQDKFNKDATVLNTCNQ